MAKLNKKKLVEIVANEIGLSLVDAEVVVKTFFDSIIKSLASDERIEIRGFGVFSVNTRQERSGRNPKTGEKVTVPTRRFPVFKVGKELSETINAELKAQQARNILLG